MRYMMLIYTKEENLESMSPDEADRTTQGHVHVITETRKPRHARCRNAAGALECHTVRVDSVRSWSGWARSHVNVACRVRSASSGDMDSKFSSFV